MTKNLFNFLLPAVIAASTALATPAVMAGGSGTFTPQLLPGAASPFKRQGLPGIEQLGSQGPDRPGFSKTAPRFKRLFGKSETTGLGIDTAAPGTQPCPPNCKILEAQVPVPIPRPPELRPNPIDCRRNDSARRDCIAAGYPVR